MMWNVELWNRGLERAAELESWRAGELESWRAGELESYEYEYEYS